MSEVFHFISQAVGRFEKDFKVALRNLGIHQCSLVAGRSQNVRKSSKGNVKSATSMSPSS